MNITLLSDEVETDISEGEITRKYCKSIAKSIAAKSIE